MGIFLINLRKHLKNFATILQCLFSEEKTTACLKDGLNLIALVGCAKYSVAKLSCFRVQNVFYLNAFNHARTLHLFL